MNRHEQGVLPAWIDALDAALLRHGRAVLVLVAQVSGSVPRESGAAMVVTACDASGTIGGGHLEHEAQRLARDALATGAANPSNASGAPGASAWSANWLVRFPLSARLGQCCGGVVSLAFIAMSADARGWLDNARICARTGAAFALVAELGGDTPNRRLVVSADDARGTLGDAGRDSAAIAFVRARLSRGTVGTLEMPLPGSPGQSLLVQIERPDPFPVLLFGNGHVARALVQVLGVLSAQVRWIDAREDAFPTDVPGNVVTVATDVPEAEIRHASHGSFVLVMTHSHPLDFSLVETALQRDDWRYVGMIGSRSKRAQLERRLVARGVVPERLARLACPIGAPLPGLEGKAPGIIALAVAAELMAAKAACARTVAAHGLALAAPVG